MKKIRKILCAIGFHAPKKWILRMPSGVEHSFKVFYDAAEYVKWDDKNHTIRRKCDTCEKYLKSR